MAIKQEAPAKRLIVCLDGTWMNSDKGYESSLIGKGSLQIPSNVTRLSRCFKHKTSDGRVQVVSYESGVGTGSNLLDAVAGGAFGIGLSERVRQAYSYLCTNYADGDEIVLIGYSRGAFTARSVANIIGNIGLLTREGMDYFYNVFSDLQHWLDDDYNDPFPNVPFPDKPWGENADDEYRQRLEKLGLTSVKEANGKPIKVKAVCVFDTVGSLGIPRVSWLEKMGLRADNEEFKWHDTDLSKHVEHAFQALALDEHRPPFSPAVWERLPRNKNTTDLRQVWFPGNHGNCGGGWPDQGVANCTLAWMMDQMASVGIEFDHPTVKRVIEKSLDFYRGQQPDGEIKPQNNRSKEKRWATSPIFENNHPVRPWGLGRIAASGGIFYALAGSIVRSPGLYKQVDPKTKKERSQFLQDTNERIHSTVRVRLACKGLGLNDKEEWDCKALGQWRLKRTDDDIEDPVPRHAAWEPEGGDDAQDLGGPSKGRWVWEYAGKEKDAHPDPKQRTMVEEPLGPYERYFLRHMAGTPNVFEFANERDGIQ